MPERRRVLGRVEAQGDRWILVVTFFLCGFGLVMVLSASQALALLQHASPFYYFERQAAWMVLGFAGLVVLRRLGVDRLRDLAPKAAVVVVVLMLVALVPHIGVEVNGARRWLPLGPLGTLQPSELAKLVFVLYIADWIDRRGERLRSFRDGALPFALI